MKFYVYVGLIFALLCGGMYVQYKNNYMYKEQIKTSNQTILNLQTARSEDRTNVDKLKNALQTNEEKRSKLEKELKDAKSKELDNYLSTPLPDSLRSASEEYIN